MYNKRNGRCWNFLISIYVHTVSIVISQSLLLSLLWSLVEVHCQQTFPYVSFMGNTVPNHGYVDLGQVGEYTSGNDNNTVQCITDLSTCCTGAQVVIVETGISLMELDCHSLVISMRIVKLRELT